MEELEGRKVIILNAIIKNYLETGEPVGSRTISKYTDLNLSSATIRNEMQDLEELGYIISPHTSAGRIPSDKGYRFYVDHLIREKDSEISEMKALVIENTEKMDKVLQKVAKLLAADTNYATMITAPKLHGTKLKFIQLSHVDDRHILSVIVTEGNLVRNRMIDIEEPLNDEQLLKLNILLNTSLTGLSIREINLGTIAALKEQAGIHSDIISTILDAVAEVISEDEDLTVYTSGATNILKYPELLNSGSATELLGALEDKQELKTILTEGLEEDENEGKLRVYIGDETRSDRMHDCSVVTATYDLGDGVKGSVGIVGPKRMDYEKVMHSLRNLREQFGATLEKAELKIEQKEES